MHLPETRLIKIKFGIDTDKYIVEAKKENGWSPVTTPCKTKKTCIARQRRWMIERERMHFKIIQRQVMALSWRDVHV